jgi:hypothetical protein
MTIRTSNIHLAGVRYPAFYDGDARAATYRYFVTDLLTNTIIQEIPFTGVSFSRAVKGAGDFTGSIPVIDETDHLDLYDSTMPGKTGLYVTRDGVCVWGGIIWTRSYDLVSKTLNVRGNEFTSYFYHRNIWRTWSNEIGCTLTKAGSTATALLEYGVTHDFVVGSTVQLTFREIEDWPHNGIYTVTGWDGMDTVTLDAPYLPVGSYALTTMMVRTDTYEFIRNLIDATMVDFIGISFANDEIEPATGTDVRIIYYEVISNVVTLYTQVPHGALAGQVIEVRNVEDDINGQYLIDTIPDDRTMTFTAYTTIPDVPNTYTPVKSASVTSKVIYDYTATLTTSPDHGFQVGDIVGVSNVDDGVTSTAIYNGVYQVTEVPTPSSFKYITSSVIDRAYTAVSGGSVVAPPFVTVGTYGPYPLNSDLWIEFNTAAMSGKTQDPMIYRGFEVRSLGDALDTYTDTINAFEYRIDCVYDEEYALFRRIFYMIPIDFPDPPASGEISPISRFGADKLIFTYPGNITDIKIDESAENAATRFFMVGNIPELGDDASQPYAVATADDLLLQGWPVLDAEEANQDISDETELALYADRYLAESRPPIAEIKVTVNGSMTPKIGSFYPGDWCSLVMNDPFVQMRLASDLEPRDTVLVRKIDVFKVNVPDFPAYPEVLELTLIPEWQVDRVGE